MKEKTAFIFITCDTQNPIERNEEISKLYMNRIAIDEEDQFEVLNVEKCKIKENFFVRSKRVKNWHIKGVSKTAMEALEKLFMKSMMFYQTEIRKVKVQKS